MQSNFRAWKPRICRPLAITSFQGQQRQLYGEVYHVDMTESRVPVTVESRVSDFSTSHKSTPSSRKNKPTST